MTSNSILNAQKLVKKMYVTETIETVQKRACNMYYLMLSKGYTESQAQKEILEHGIKYNDLIAGILTKGIDD